MQPRDIASALLTLAPAKMRGAIVRKHGAEFLLDCYNANPSSMQSAIRTLADYAGPRRKIALVGDMLELGRFSEPLHIALGRELARAGMARVIAVGEFGDNIKEGAVRAGLARSAVVTVRSANEAIAPARALIKRGDVVLVKASRALALENVFNAL
jgi:UDP-N-acetylmuramoyl-tripeptide--D-alanyl-D-alanine ligase